MRRLVICLLCLSFITASRIYGNRYSHNNGVFEVMLVPPVGLFWTPRSCIFMPHTTFFTGSTTWTRHYSDIEMVVRWMSETDAKIDVEVNQIEDYLKTKQNDNYLYNQSRLIRDTSKGNVTISFNPLKEHVLMSTEPDFLAGFPEVVTEICLTNKGKTEAKVFVESSAVYHDLDFDVERINDLDGDELMQAVSGVTSHFITEYYRHNPDSKVPPIAVKSNIEQKLHKDHLSDEAIEKLEEHFQKMNPDDEYMYILPFLEIINERIEKATGMAKANGKPFIRDTHYAGKIASRQNWINISHLTAVVVVPMISTLAVKAFNYS